MPEGVRPGPFVPRFLIPVAVLLADGFRGPVPRLIARWSLLVFCGAGSLLFGPACYADLLRKTDAEAMNTEFRERTYVARQDIYAPFNNRDESTREVLVKRGEKVRLFVETSREWIRVRAIPVSEQREHNPGRVVVYVLRDFVEQEAEEGQIESYPREKLDAEILRILAPSGP